MRRVVTLATIWILAELTNYCQAQPLYNDERFTEVIEKLETDAREFRTVLETLYNTRKCNATALAACAGSNWDECLSQFPHPSCPAGPSYHVPRCGDALDQCSAVYDFTISNIRFPAGQVDGNGRPRDTRLIEDICFSREMDGWVQQRRDTDAPFWNALGVEPRAFYFGSHTGTFRIFPARHSEQCRIYDPRLRPWYVAGSSGRKNVLLIVDKSGSMDGPLLDLLKDATKRVVDTLTDGDRVGIVAFDSEAQVIADEDGKILYPATQANKLVLHAAIDALQARRHTNFYDAFDKAFDVLDATILEELDVACNTAILFFTDGKLFVPGLNITEQDVMALVNTRITKTRELARNKPILLFTYSISEMEEDVEVFPHQLACSQEIGISSNIADRKDIVNALSSYYLLFALGLGSDRNDNFVAWVEPYTFVTGSILGTTVSVPVYDRTKQPYLFLGVAAIDIALNALAVALGAATDDTATNAMTTEAITRIARRSLARCPTMDLTPCELEFYRAATSGKEAQCGITCPSDDYIETQIKPCTTIEKYPTDLYANRYHENQSFEQYACCSVQSSTTNGKVEVCGSTLPTVPSSTSVSRRRWSSRLFPLVTLVGMAGSWI